MMEDIMALVLVTLVVVIMAYVVYRVVKKNRQAEKEYQERQAKTYERLAEMRRETARKLNTSNSTTYVSPKVAPKNTVTPAATATPTPVDNWSNDLLTTMIITDMLSSHKTVTPAYSTSSSDFGLDDSDSRKSSSSSFSSSDSSSSWSDSSSSSSDSGPSSDW